MTDFSISDSVSKTFLAGWSIISGVLSLLGNMFVIVASKRYNAIKLDRVSIVLLENLAVADIGTSLFTILPRVSDILIYDSSTNATLNTLQRKIIIVPSFIFLSISWILYPSLNCCKLFSLIYPLRARNLRFKHGYKIVLTIWSFFILLYSALRITEWIIDNELFFYLASIRISTIATPLLLLLTIVSTIALLLTVHKARGLGKKGAISISLVSAVYCVCYTPMCVILTFTSINGPGKFSPNLGVAFINFHSISSFSNPIIYYFTLRSFKEYTDTMFRRCFRSTSAANSNNGN